jgi:hypothetical protein
MAAEDDPKPVIERHVWMGAANIPLTPSSARVADRGGRVKVTNALVVDVVEVYCGKCMQPHSRVAGTDCITDTTHLRGGPIGRRQRSKPDAADGDDVLDTA